ncbi:MAG: hypothetical protein AMXMBFR82_53350 [Candidatus Hydrogenedentota bacterium]
METDPIIDEIHKIRAALSEASGDDIRKIAEAAKARQAQSGKRAVRLHPRKPKTAQKAS